MSIKIKVEGLFKSFGKREVLHDINFDVKDKEIFVIIGGSGSGKSTVIKHIIGLLKPSSGRVLVDSVDVGTLKNIDLIEFRKKVGYLFQEGALFDSLKIWENVGFYYLENTKMSTKEIKKIAIEKLSLVGLKDIEDLYPSQLSGGMRKRVSLARAISYNPEIILYDEPTSGLDPVTSAMIDKLILKLRDEIGVTSVVVTHDLESAFSIADRIMYIHKGRVIAIGTPQEIRESQDPTVRQFINRLPEGPITQEFFEEIKTKGGL